MGKLSKFLALVRWLTMTNPGKDCLANLSLIGPEPTRVYKTWHVQTLSSFWLTVND